MAGQEKAALPHAMPAPGDVIAGKYELVRVLGEGGMGIVFEANHVRLRQRVALKMLLPQMLSEETIVSRFEREARAAAQLRSRHVARVMDVDVTAAGLPYMVMELLQGHDLDAELLQRGKIPHPEAVEYVLQACAAMHEAHQVGIVHRDLKPSNLFLEREGEQVVVKVLDFGISKLQGDADKLTAAGAIMGTAFYMSPEQVRSSGNVDARSDIWALGVILYELLCGEPPFTGTTTQVAAAIVTEDPKDLRARCLVPGDLADAIGRAMRRDPKDRFQDVRSLAAALLPHAPPDGLGYAAGEALTRTSDARVGRARATSVVPAGARRAAPGDGAADTEVNAPSRTVPGWTQGGVTAPSSRRRRVVFGAAIGVVAVAGIGLALGTRPSKDVARPAAAEAPVATPTSLPPATVASIVPVSAAPDAGAIDTTSAPVTTSKGRPRAPKAGGQGAPQKPASPGDSPPQLPPPPVPKSDGTNGKAPAPPKPTSNPLTL